MKKAFRTLTVFADTWRALLHSMACLESSLEPRPVLKLVVMMAGLLIAWHVYVPIHELMHVAGCKLGGGTVESLALSPQYGAHALGIVFPFVVPESEYAGQLTGFTTPNAWAYALTDFFPYLFSLFGVALLEWCRRKRAAWLMGSGFILAFVPVMSIPGDYYEACSLITSPIAGAWHTPAQSDILVSDDVFKLVGELAHAGVLDAPHLALVTLTLILAIYAALLTVAIQVRLAEVLFRIKELPVLDKPQSRNKVQEG